MRSLVRVRGGPLKWLGNHQHAKREGQAGARLGIGNGWRRQTPSNPATRARSKSAGRTKHPSWIGQPAWSPRCGWTARAYMSAICWFRGRCGGLVRQRMAPPRPSRAALLAISGILTLVITPLLLNIVTPLIPEQWIQQHRPWVIGIFTLIATITVELNMLVSTREAEAGNPSPGLRQQGHVVAGGDVHMPGSSVQVSGGHIDNMQVHLEPAPPPSPRAGPAPGRIGNLPSHHQAFTGRAELLNELHRRLVTGRAVILHGLGGVGKSRIALEYAHQQRRTYSLIWWIQAETPLAATTTLAALAPRLGLDVEADQERTCRAVIEELARRDDWLLIFDGVDGPESLLPFLPGGDSGRVLITSRHPGLGSHAHRIEVRELPHDEAVEFLLAGTAGNDRPTAETVARELGGLPLALAQAVAYIDQVPDVDLAGYLERHRRSPHLLASAQPQDYPGTVLTTWQLNLDQVSRSDPAAAQLLQLLAFLAPAVTIPRELLTAAPGILPEPLQSACRSGLGLDQAIAALYRYSLVSRSGHGISVHPLVQHVTRNQLPDDQARHWVDRAVRLSLAAFPDRPINQGAWPRATVLLPHALTATENAKAEQVAAPATAALLDLMGLFLDSRGALTDARGHLEHALHIKEALHGPDAPQVAVALTNLGIVFVKSAEPGPARHLLERALEIKLAQHGPEHPEVAITLTNLGNALRKLGQLSAALSAQRQALRLFEQAYGAEDPRVANVLTNLGIALNKSGRPQAARVRLERAVRIKRAHFGADHPEVAIPLTNLGNALRKLGELADSRHHLSWALDIERAAYGEEHPWVAYTLTNLGNTLRELGDLTAARAAHEQALRIKEGAFGASHQEVGVTLTNLAKVLHDQSHLGAARDAHQRALRIFTDWSDDLWAASVRTNLGNVLREMGDLDAAGDMQRRALQTFERIYRPGHPQIAITLTNLGEVLRDRGESPAAVDCFERAVAILRSSLGATHLATCRAERLLHEPPAPMAP
jgi:tetratricopeptide (TPR) repeat protein